MNRHLDYAIAIAKSSNVCGFHFSALIFAGKNVISCGWCREKSHPRQAKYMQYAKEYKRRNNWLHAEIHALVAAKRDVSGFDMIVTRWAEEKIKTSHPCGACFQAISIAGIRNLWYYNDETRNWICRPVGT